MTPSNALRTFRTFRTFGAFRTSSALLLFGLVTLALADPLPAARPGNWDLTVSIGGQPGTSLQKVCRAPGAFNPGQSLDRLEKAGMTCDHKEVTAKGPVVTLDYLCKLKGTDITSHSDTTFTGDTAYHSEIHTRYQSASGSISDTAIVLDGKWTGPCAEGQTPE